MRFRKSDFFPIVIIIIFSLICGCQNPVHRWDSDSPEEYFAKAEKHYKLAKEASKFSKSLELMHYRHMKVGLSYYNSHRKKESTIDGISLRELETGIIPEIHKLAKEEARSGLFDLALYLFAIEDRVRSVSMSIDLMLIADAMEKYGDKSKAQKVRNHVKKSKSLIDKKYIEIDMESAYKRRIESIKNKGKGQNREDEVVEASGYRARASSWNERHKVAWNERHKAALTMIKNRQYDKTKEYFRQLSETNLWESNPDIFKELFSAIDTDDGVSTILSIINSLKDDDLRYTLFIYLAESIGDNNNIHDWQKHLEQIRNTLINTKKFHSLNLIAEMKVAEAYRAKGNTQLAGEIIQKATTKLKSRTIYVKNDKSLITGIATLIGMGMKDKAREILNTSSKRHDGDGRRYGSIQLAQGHALLGDFDQMENIFGEKGSEEVSDVNLIKSYIELAYYFHGLNKQQEANDCLDIALENYKDKNIDASKLKSEILFERYLFATLKDYKQIREFADLMDGPSDDPFTTTISESYSAQGKLDWAFETAKNMNRAQWKAQRMAEIARGYLENGDWQKALVIWEYLENDEASRKDSNTQFDRNNIKNGVVMEQAFQGHYEKALETVWKGHETLKSAGYFARGLMLRALDSDMDESEQRSIVESIAPKVFEFEYLQDLRGVKDTEYATRSENDLVKCAEYLADPGNIELNKFPTRDDKSRKERHPWVIFTLARGYIDLGMNDKALETLILAFKEVISYVDNEKYDSYNNHTLLLEMADQLFRIDKKDKAIEVLDYAREKSALLLKGLNPQSSDMSKLFKAYYKAGEMEKAQAFLDEIKSNPPIPANNAFKNYARDILHHCLIIQGKYDEVFENASTQNASNDMIRWLSWIINEEKNSGYKAVLENINRVEDLNWRLSLVARLLNAKINEETRSEVGNILDIYLSEIAGYKEPEKAIQTACKIAEIYIGQGKEDRGNAVIQTLEKIADQIKDKKSRKMAKWLIAIFYANLGDLDKAKEIKPSRSIIKDKIGQMAEIMYFAATAVGYAKTGDYEKAMRVAREHNNKYKSPPYDLLVRMAEAVINRGDYDEAYSILETAYDTHWKEDYDSFFVRSIITTPKEHYFVGCPKMFLDVNRVDLAIKCLRFFRITSWGGESGIVKALMMIEKKRRETGYILNDSDKAFLSGIIRDKNPFASYNHNLVELNGPGETELEI